MPSRTSVVACAIVAAVGLGCSDDTDTTSDPSQGGNGGTAGMPAGGGGAGAEGGGGQSCVNSLPADDELPDMLSATGLYTDIAAKEVSPLAQPFAPQYELWSDAADKQRWIYLPECGVIDSSNGDDWSMAVGTRMWKEFSVGGDLIETRLIERTGPGARDFQFAAYVWNTDLSDAVRTPLGLADANGTNHDVPSEEACRRCHGSHEKRGGRPSRALGFSALQLAHSSAGVTLASLSADGLLSDAPAATPAAPGDAVAQAALGYLHANCGHCHNATVDGVPQVSLNLWLDADQTTVETTNAYLTAVSQPNEIFNDQNVTARIEPADPDTSSVFYRMGQRGNNAQMPPVGSEVVDATGLAAVQAWIAGLPP